MPEDGAPVRPRKRRVNLTISRDVIDSAKELGLNASEAAEAGIAAAVKKAREDAWRRENRAAIEAHNERIEADGPALKPHWADRD